MKDQNLTRRERQKIRNRADIMAAATKLFAQRGYHEVAMSEIAAEAEFATGTLYNFFPSKAALYKAIVEEAAAYLFAEIRSLLEQGDNEVERLRSFLLGFSDIVRQYAAPMRLYFVMTPPPSDSSEPTLQDEVLSLRAPTTRALTDLFSSGMAKGLFRQGDPEDLAFMVGGALQNLAQAYISLRGEKELPVSACQALLDLILQGIESD